MVPVLPIDEEASDVPLHRTPKLSLKQDGQELRLAENNHEYLKAALMDQLALAVQYGHVNFTILNSFGETIL